MVTPEDDFGESSENRRRSIWTSLCRYTHTEWKRETKIWQIPDQARRKFKYNKTKRNTKKKTKNEQPSKNITWSTRRRKSETWDYASARCVDKRMFRLRQLWKGIAVWQNERISRSMLTLAVWLSLSMNGDVCVSWLQTEKLITLKSDCRDTRVTFNTRSTNSQIP